MSDRSQGETALVQFSERLTNSAAFGTVFREGMDLVEETAAYLDGAGRTEAKALDRAVSLTYATESMRLTTRLMQLASWLLLHRAVKEGIVHDCRGAQRIEGGCVVRCPLVDRTHRAVGVQSIRQAMTTYVPAREIRVGHRGIQPTSPIERAVGDSLQAPRDVRAELVVGSSIVRVCAGWERRPREGPVQIGSGKMVGAPRWAAVARRERDE